MKHPKTPLIAGLVLALALAGAAALWLRPGAADMRPLETRLAALLDAVPRDEVPGLLLLVAGPEESLRLARGTTARGGETAIGFDHVMRAGSVAKTYVAALTLMAAEAGRLSLDDPLSAHLGPEVMARLPEGLDPDLRQLLNHSSGVPDYYTERFYTEDWDRSQPITPDLVLHAIRGLPAGAPGVPGYSNTNYHLLALVLEAVQEAPLDVLLRQNLLEPLGLRRTFYDMASPPGDEIHGYGSPFDPWEETTAFRENSGPDGGLFMTPDDLAVWLRALFAETGALARIGQTMAEDPLPAGERKAQGLGVEILTSRSGVRVLGHTGSVDGYLTAGFYIPEVDRVLVLHMNRSDEARFSELLGGALAAIIATGGVLAPEGAAG